MRPLHLPTFVALRATWQARRLARSIQYPDLEVPAPPVPTKSGGGVHPIEALPATIMKIVLTLDVEEARQEELERHALRRWAGWALMVIGLLVAGVVTVQVLLELLRMRG